MRKSRVLFAAGAVLYVSSVALHSQTFRGGISGSVVDSSAAAVSGAVVAASSPAIGLERKTITTAAGEFSFSDLPLGEYQVEVSHPGFTVLRVQKVSVEVGKVTGLHLALEVASQKQVVEVAASVVSLDTETATANQVIPNKAVQEVPLNGRDFTQLIKLAPGVNGAGSLNGARTTGMNWQIDGADNNDLWHNSAAVNQGGVSGVAGTLLPIDAIDQFSVQSQANAEAGRNSGGSVNMVIKSGTNDLHGSIYYFNRNDALSALSPFASVKGKLKNNQFGGSAGGAIVKNKLFYFLTYERQKFIVGNKTQATEPSAAWVSQATSVLSSYSVAVNPVATNLLSFWPSRGRTGAATSPNFYGSDNSDNYSDNGIGKIDYILSPKDSIAFRYFAGTGTQTAPVGSPYREYYQVAPSRMHNFSLVYNRVISPRIVNQLTAGVNYFKQTFNDFDTSFNPVAAGLNTGVTNPSLNGSPDIAISGFDEIGLTPPLGRIDTTGHLNESLTFTTGRHQYRIGGEFRRSRMDVFYQRNARGTFSFDGSQGPWASNSTLSDNVKSLADFMAGYVQSAGITRGDLQRDYYINDSSLFAQDTFKFSSKLSVDYGVRWEYFGPISDPTNRISTFLPGSGIVFTGGSGLDTIYPVRHNNIAPRIGFAYAPKAGGKLVFRGHYGIFFEQPQVNAFGDNRPPNKGATGILSNPAGSDPVYSLARSSFAIVSGQAIFGDSNIPAPPYGVFSVDQGFKNASSQNFGLNVQYQLSRSTVLEVGGVASLGHHLINTRDINQAPVSSLGTSATLAVQNKLRPYYAMYPNYATINQVGSGANSHYAGLVTSLKTSAWHGLTSQFAYTTGHAIDNASAVRGVTPTNSNDLKNEYGSSAFDVRQTFTSYVVYNVPNAPRGPKLLLNGWQGNVLASAYTGTPLTIYAGKNYSGTFEGRDRVVQVSDPFANVSSGYWFNPAAFAAPAAGTFGTLGRNTLRAPGLATVDFALVKNTPITERIRTQLRVEFFNLFNRTNLAPPTTTLSSGSFGKVTDTIGDYNGAPGIGAGEPFNMQIGLKIVF